MRRLALVADIDGIEGVGIDTADHEHFDSNIGIDDGVDTVVPVVQLAVGVDGDAGAVQLPVTSLHVRRIAGHDTNTEGAVALGLAVEEIARHLGGDPLHSTGRLGHCRIGGRRMREIVSIKHGETP